MASQPPSASTPTMPSDGMAVSAGLYLAVSLIMRSRDANRFSLASFRRSCSCCSWPKPLTTRTPPMASSTTPATSPDCCCACQLTGNSLRRDASAIIHSAGATATVTSVSSGESTTMIPMDSTNSARLPSVIGTMDKMDCTMFRSEMDRPTSCPVWISSWRAPSSRDSESKSSVRRSCCTSRESLPPR